MYRGSLYQLPIDFNAANMYLNSSALAKADIAYPAALPCLSRCSGTAGGSGCVVVDGAREQMDR